MRARLEVANRADDAGVGTMIGSPAEHDGLARRTFLTARTIAIGQVIAGAVLWGIALFLSNRGQLPTSDSVGIVAVVFGVVSLLAAVAAFVVPSLMVRSACSSPRSPMPGVVTERPSTGDPRMRILPTLQTASILGGALAESILLLGFVLMIMGGGLILFGVFTMVSVAAWIGVFPQWPIWHRRMDEAATAGVIHQ